MTESAVRDAFAKQAVWCDRLGSPFTALVCRLAGERLDRGSAVSRRILDWPGDPDALGDGLPLRLSGTLHALARRGDAPNLAAAYPPNDLPAPERLWALIADAIVAHEAFILARLDRAPQTNEVGRSGPLMAGMLTIAAQTGLPLSLFELGASAGLNLNLDRFSYRLGETVAGDPDSKVQISPAWTGPSPPQTTVKVAARRGVDLSPLDVANVEDRELLTAYVWPDQQERLLRVLAAMEIALAFPPPLDRGDAADWLEAVLDPAPQEGVTRVVYHTVAFQYFPAAAQQRIRARLETAGTRARASAPLAWLSFENEPAMQGRTVLRLTLWPGGGQKILGVGHPHGAAMAFGQP
jgi:hypothetical protein